MNEYRLLENGNVKITIPLVSCRIAGKQKFIPKSPEEPDKNSLILSIAKAFDFQEMIDSGKFENGKQLAEAMKLDRSYVARILRLLLLSPKIIHGIIVGDQGLDISQEILRRSIPISWDEQEKLYFK